MNKPTLRAIPKIILIPADIPKNLLKRGEGSFLNNPFVTLIVSGKEKKGSNPASKLTLLQESQFVMKQ